MNIAVIGAGAQGAPCTAILARQPAVRRILLGSSTLAAATTVRDRVGDKVIAAQFDANDPSATVRAVREAIGGAAVVIDMTPSFCSPNVMKAALALKAHS